MGFPVPVGRWLRDRFWPLVAEFVLGPRASARGLFDRTALVRMAEEHRSGRVRHGDRLWLLINLEIWQRIFCEGEDPAEVMRANPLGQDEWAVAGHNWRASAKPADRVGAVPAS
jgi:hypothetical protein